MNSLILDCSFGMNIVVKKDDEVFPFFDENQKRHSDELLVKVDDLLTQANLNVMDIDNLCVCIGPGSFTGIRVAVSIVKGLAVAGKFKVFVISNFAEYDLENESNYILILEGFSHNVYVRECEKGKYTQNCLDISSIKDLNLKGKTIFVQTEKLQKTLFLDEIHSKIAKNNLINAFDDKILNKQDIALNEIEPIYLRLAQAEIDRKKRLSENKNGKN